MPQPLREVLASDSPTFSFEFSPPRDDAGERVLWRSIRELEALRPSFVSVTYGAGGSTRDRTVRITEQIASETTLDPVGHLTCVAQSREELRRVIGQYAAAGVRNVLALRGDPPGGPTADWERHPDGLDHAVDLVEMLRELGRFCVGVAAFPEKHPGAESLEHDARVLAAKAEAGAEFAVTQFFFRADDYFSLVERARSYGCHIPVLPGIMPITNLSQIQRFAELSGAEVPSDVTARIEAVGDDAAAVRAEGTQIATELCETLLAEGAPGLHFYTLNRSRATRQIYADLALASR
ncbi:methylenetetrahydrofolate reductase [NAD(P)H] [Solicola sp. PLA-1-18]|uniref:methylenetetrahydrofolate reductase [NAD(P)H] n=1 Tax=Solicola sp. PLA-1-18 TaxID=3380532 RepID=UPI003B7EADDC